MHVPTPRSLGSLDVGQLTRDEALVFRIGDDVDEATWPVRTNG